MILSGSYEKDIASYPLESRTTSGGGDVARGPHVGEDGRGEVHGCDPCAWRSGARKISGAAIMLPFLETCCGPLCCGGILPTTQQINREGGLLILAKFPRVDSWEKGRTILLVPGCAPACPKGLGA